MLDKNGRPMGVRLKGGMFERNFDGDDYEPHIKARMHKVYDHSISANQRNQKNRADLNAGIALKRIYHMKKYSSEPKEYLNERQLNQSNKPSKNKGLRR